MKRARLSATMIASLIVVVALLLVFWRPSSLVPGAHDGAAGPAPGGVDRMSSLTTEKTGPKRGAPNGGDGERDPVVIRGFVIDEAGGLRPTDATVSLQPAIATSRRSGALARASLSAGGAFELRYLPPNAQARSNVLLALTAVEETSGRRSRSHVGTLTELVDAGAVVLRLEAARVIRARVVDEAGTPVPMARVRVDELPRSPTGAWDRDELFTRRQGLSAGADGRISATVRLGRARVWVAAPGGAFSAPTFLPDDGSQTPVDLGDLVVPTEAIELRVRVVDRDGEPVHGAGLMLEYTEYVAASRPETGVSGKWHAVVDAEGVARLRFRRETGPVAIGVGAAGYRSNTLCVEPDRLDSTGVEVRLDREPRLRVRFRTPDDRRHPMSAVLAEIAEVHVAPLDEADDSDSPPLLVAPSDIAGVHAISDEVRPVQRATWAARASERLERDPDGVELHLPSPGRYRLSIDVPLLGRWIDHVEVLDWGEHAKLSVMAPGLEYRRLEATSVGSDEPPSTVIHAATASTRAALGDSTPIARRSPPPPTTPQSWNPRWSLLSITSGRTDSLLVPEEAEVVVLQRFARGYEPRGDPLQARLDASRGAFVVETSAPETVALDVQLVSRDGPVNWAGVIVEVERRDDGTDPLAWKRREIHTNSTGAGRVQVVPGRYRVRLAGASGGSPWTEVDVDGDERVELAL